MFNLKKELRKTIKIIKKPYSYKKGDHKVLALAIFVISICLTVLILTCPSNHHKNKINLNITNNGIIKK